MSKNIYKDNCIAYLKKGYSVIPDGYMKKRPAIKAWTEYCTRLPSEEEVTNWATSFNETNIAVCLGEASQIVALDLDCTDPEILKILEPLLPSSPSQKVGSKGWTRFFKFKGEATATLKIKGEVALELLSTGKKTTIPPSLHTSGQEYRWVGKSLLEVDKDELPILPPYLFSHLEMKLQAAQVDTHEYSKKKKGGRHIALGSQASQLISEHKDVTTAVTSLIRYDAEYHDRPLFTDSDENQGFPNAFVNALKFYTDYLKSINHKRYKEKKPLELPYSAFGAIKSFKSDLVHKDDAMTLPEPTGLLKEIKDYILARSYVEQPVFATSAALSLVGALVRRSVVFQGATPNMYILNIANSGSGKDSCQQAIKDILHAVGKTELLGATTYPSEASITANLHLSPSRLDIIDEAASFLQTATVAGAAYQTGIGDTLCELYSCSNSHYLGKVLASMDGKKVGECYRPHLSLLCSTTYKGVSEGLSRATLEKGLFARFLLFFGEDDKRGKRVAKFPTLSEELLDKLKYLGDFHNPLESGNMPQNFKPYELTVSKDADQLLTKYHEEFDLMRTSQDPNSTVRPIVARLYQQMLKITLISALGNIEIGNVPKVTTKDVEFAYKLINFYFQSIEGFVEDNLYDSARGYKVNKILKLIKEAGKDGIKTADLTKYTKSITFSERQEIIKDLIHSAQISVETLPNTEGVIFRSTND